MLVFEERGEPEYPEKKTSRSKGENQQQTQPNTEAEQTTLVIHLYLICGDVFFFFLTKNFFFTNLQFI